MLCEGIKVTQNESHVLNRSFIYKDFFTAGGEGFSTAVIDGVQFVGRKLIAILITAKQHISSVCQAIITTHSLYQLYGETRVQSLQDKHATWYENKHVRVLVCKKI